MPILNKFLRTNCGKVRSAQIWIVVIAYGAMGFAFGFMVNNLKASADTASATLAHQRTITQIQKDHEVQREGLRATNLVLRQFFEKTSPELVTRIDDLVAKVDKIADDTGRLMTSLAMANTAAAQAGETAAQAAVRADEALKQTRLQATTVKRAAETQVKAAKEQVKATEELRSTTEDLNAIIKPVPPAPAEPIRIGPLYPNTGGGN